MGQPGGRPGGRPVGLSGRYCPRTAQVTGPAQVQITNPARPPAMTMAERAQALAAELRPGIEPDPDLCAVMPTDDATEQDRAVRIARERQRFTALDKTLAGDPSAAPDQRAFLVVTPRTKRDLGVTAYSPSPPTRLANTASHSQRGAHIHTISPRGPTTAPRSPSASSA